MKLCVISFKECWQDENGKWYSYGGFPLQMKAIGSLFDEMTLIITKSQSQMGGIPLPESAIIVPLRKPSGVDTRRKLSVLRHLPKYVSILKKFISKADVVHVPLPGDIPLIGMVITLFMRKRMIARYGGSWYKNSRTTFMNRVTRFIMRSFAGNRNVMLATGDFPEPPGRNIQWIFVTSISRSEFDNISPILNRGLSSPPQMAFIGRLSEEKGVSLLIRAIHVLKQMSFTPMPVVDIFGDGPLKQELLDLTLELGVESFLNFHGQLNRQSLSKELMKKDLTIQPSLTEGFSKAWLDSMLHGLPVIATDVSCARGVIGWNGARGWIVQPNNVNALATLIIKVISNENIDWHSLRKRCRAYVEKYTLEAWSERIAKICCEQWDLIYIDGKLQK